MKYTQLGNSGIKVSCICLGTMTFGEQNTQTEAHAQMDYALEHGVNFFDTAEMYSIPPKSETQGLTESYIGNWLNSRNNRDKLVLATKVAGPADWMSHLRNGPRLNKQHIREALHDSLRRLQTDYVDLYQVHWPERQTNFFGQLGYQHQPEQDGIAIEETLDVLSRLMDEGKVRSIGVSNETPWGVMRYLELAEHKGWSRIVSIQNPYNLLNRSFEVGLSEISHRENVGLLAYSPLAFGVLTGKYLDGARPPAARLTLFEGYNRYSKPPVESVIGQYVALARQHHLSPSQMALAYVTSRPFVTANIIGATNLSQLKENIDSIDLQLNHDVIEGIEAIHSACPNIAP
jgi:aryl-alcohol dehydrogenase-like predicted oxidoreductase